MQLASMRFKDYVWPHNPNVYSIRYERCMVNHKVPYGYYALQDLGLTRRVMEGEGEFIGETAYDDFKALATLFYQTGSGTLVHPIWQTAEAYFVDLSLKQEPQPNYVAYTFTFWEDTSQYTTGLTEVATTTTASDTTTGTASGSGTGTTTTTTTTTTSQELWHTVTSGETLWGIASTYDLSLSDLIELNPQIKNPNLISIGEQVRVA